MGKSCRRIVEDILLELEGQTEFAVEQSLFDRIDKMAGFWDQAETEDFTTYDVLKILNSEAIVNFNDLVCGGCGRTQTPKKQFRLNPTECGQKTACIGWVCCDCEELNLTPDDLAILNAEFIH